MYSLIGIGPFIASTVKASAEGQPSIGQHAPPSFEHEARGHCPAKLLEHPEWIDNAQQSTAIVDKLNSIASSQPARI
jgi:hypothetical protein